LVGPDCRKLLEKHTEILEDIRKGMVAAGYGDAEAKDFVNKHTAVLKEDEVVSTITRWVDGGEADVRLELDVCVNASSTSFMEASNLAKSRASDGTSGPEPGSHGVSVPGRGDVNMTVSPLTFVRARASSDPVVSSATASLRADLMKQPPKH
jgi:hypothetical protein